MGSSSEGRWTKRFPGVSSIWERPGSRGGGASDVDPQERAAEVMRTIDQANAGTISKRGALDWRLAALWASAVVDGLGWECIDLRTHDGRSTSGVVSDPSRRWVVDPHELVRRLLRLDGSDSDDNTALLLYNMIGAGRLPPSEPGSYLRIG